MDHAFEVVQVACYSEATPKALAGRAAGVWAELVLELWATDSEESVASATESAEEETGTKAIMALVQLGGFHQLGPEAWTAGLGEPMVWATGLVLEV